MSLISNKKKTFVLIIIVLVIWGGLSFKVIKSIGQEDLTPPTSKTKQNEIAKVNKRQKHTVQPYSIDPFLGKPTIEKKKKSTQIIKKSKLTHPNIIYLGKLQSTKKTLHLFKMNGRIIQWGIGEKKIGYVLEKKQTQLMIRHVLTNEILPLIQSEL